MDQYTEVQDSLVAQTVKNPSAMQETQVRSLSWEDPLEKGMATHSNIFAWRITWTEEPGGLFSSWSHKKSDTTEWLNIYTNTMVQYNIIQQWKWKTVEPMCQDGLKKNFYDLRLHTHI